MKQLFYLLSISSLILLGSCKNTCDDFTCFNGGTCEDGTCLCKTGYGGRQCTILLDSCIDVSCGIHQHCQSGTCVCDSGWTGTNCQTVAAINLCDSIVCGAHSYSCNNGVCLCMSGWTGVNCDTPVIPPPPSCALVDCGNHGQCVNGICQCDIGWTGAHCENQILPIDSFTGTYHIEGYHYSSSGGSSTPHVPIDTITTVTATSASTIHIYGYDAYYVPYLSDPLHAVFRKSSQPFFLQVTFRLPADGTFQYDQSYSFAGGGSYVILVGNKIY